MKKNLSTMFAMIAALLAMPYHAKAETWAYYLYGEINGWKQTNAMTADYKFGETSNGSDQDHPSWTKKFTGAQLDSDGNGVAYFKILLVKDGTTDINLGPSGGNQVLEVNGSAQTLHLNNSGDGAYMVTGINKDAEYTIMYVSTTRNGGTISITGPDTENKNIKLKGSYSKDNWETSTAYTSFSDGIYTWEFDKSGFPSGTKFKLFEYVDGTNDLWYGNGKEVTEDWSNEFSNGGDMSVSYTDNDELIKISVQAKKSNGNWMIRIVKTYEPHDYYWVSPQVTNNQKWPYFRLVPSRNRWRNGGDGQISSKYYTFTIQDEFIKQFNGSDMPKDTQIQWYIVRDDGKVFYRPESKLPVNDTPTTYDTNHGGSGTLDSHVSYKNYWGEGYGNYKTTDANRSGSFSFSKGSAKAYTFNLNAEKGHVFFNYTTASGDTDKDYYLIGNFTSAKGEVDISIDNTHPMTKYWYVGSTKYESEQNPCDSIVYKVNVTKPAEGWGDLYIDINPSGNTDWKDVIRPLINLGNNLDGRALHGGLVVNNSDQSLNPETSDDYIGYTFSFNATTFTYQLEFHTSLYLVGPGVSATQGSGSWDLSKVKSPEPSDPRIRLTATQEKDHYRNRVYFTQGQPFRFIRNTDESTNLNYAYTWYENNNKPKWKTANNKEDYYPGSETQFRNYIQYESDGSDSSTEPKDATTNSMTFDLPSGWYYVNFYPNATTPYYTIEHSIELRDFENVTYNGKPRTIEGRGGYNFFRVWSDHIAWEKPENIDVFVLSSFVPVSENSPAQVTLTKLDADYIPARTGVILASKNTKDNLPDGQVYKQAVSTTEYNTMWMDMEPYIAQGPDYTGESLLTPLYESRNLQYAENGNYNYLFGFYRKSKFDKTAEPEHFSLGFWMTTGVGNTYANSAYLSLTAEQIAKLGSGVSYNIPPEPTMSAAPCLLLSFMGNDSETTGMESVTPVIGQEEDAWYTLSGLRIDQPTQKGIYIHNGKKIAIK